MQPWQGAAQTDAEMAPSSPRDTQSHGRAP